MTDRPLPLFCTDEVWQRYEPDLRAAAPGVEPILLIGDDLVAPADIARMEVAFFSGDAFPARSAAFIKVCLEAEQLAWLHTFSAGTDSPVFRHFLQRGTRLTNSAGSSAQPIAQTVVMLMLAMSRDLPRWFRAQQSHEWDPRPHVELAGSTLAVVGLGPIGLEVVRLGQALGMNVIGCRRTPAGDEGCDVFPLDHLGDVIERADWVVLALPLTPDTRHLVDAGVLARMKPTARLVNVGRGEVVDEAALVDVLRHERIAGAALDVFTVEPLPAENLLWDLPNVIITPHSSGNTAGSHHRAAERFIDNLRRYVAGEPLVNDITLD